MPAAAREAGGPPGPSGSKGKAAAAPDTSGGRRNDSERFFCPYPGCQRSFAELWRLKVHYRAPPDVRGSGKERGHGCELQWCPKCGRELRAGRHHVGCFAGRSAPRQAAKRFRLAQAASPGAPPTLGAAPAAAPAAATGGTNPPARKRAARSRSGSAAAALAASLAAPAAPPPPSAGAGGNGPPPGAFVGLPHPAMHHGDVPPLGMHPSDLALLGPGGGGAGGVPLPHHGHHHHHPPPPPPHHHHPNHADPLAGVVGEHDLFLRPPSPPPLPPGEEARPMHLLFDFGLFDTERPHHPPLAAAPPGTSGQPGDGAATPEGGGGGGGGGGSAGGTPVVNKPMHTVMSNATSSGGDGGGDGGGGRAAAAHPDHAGLAAPWDVPGHHGPGDDYIMQIMFGEPAATVPRRVTAHLHAWDAAGDDGADGGIGLVTGGGHGAPAGAAFPGGAAAGGEAAAATAVGPTATAALLGGLGGGLRPRGALDALLGLDGGGPGPVPPATASAPPAAAPVPAPPAAPVATLHAPPGEGGYAAAAAALGPGGTAGNEHARISLHRLVPLGAAAAGGPGGGGGAPAPDV